MTSIRSRLLAGLIGGLLVCTALACTAAYLKVENEANEIFDAQLEHTALAFPPAVEARPQSARLAELDEDIVVQQWDGSYTLNYASHAQVLPRASHAGFGTIRFMNRTWRVYSYASAERMVQAAQSTTFRSKLARSLTLDILLPILALIPLLGLLIHFIVARALRPVEDIARAMARRSFHTLTPIAASGWPPELLPMVDALNSLLARLRRAVEDQRAFVADAAHELRTPLAAFKIQLQLALRAESAESRQLSLVKLEDRLERTIRLVNQLLQLARNDENARPRFEKVHLQDVAAQVVGDLQLMAEGKGIDLGLETRTPGLHVVGIPEELYALLRNLVDNAIRYSPESSRIDVVLEERQGQPLMCVIDEGPGIAAAKRKQVFHRFHRDAAPGQESGLGLAIVQGIADRHQATIELADGPGGKGLKVLVAFPSEQPR